MKRLAGITFTDKGATGNTVGYMEYVTGVVKVARYVVGYCANRQVHDRFIVEFNGHDLNLSDYVSKEDIERMQQAYMDKRITEYLKCSLDTLYLWNSIKKRLFEIK